MTKRKTHTDKTSADSTAIGFDYQYYFFLWKVLSLRTGQTIGWEVKDDIHLEVENELILYQIKHTVQSNSENKPVNLTTFDSDLWKSIANWYKIITDINDGRGTEEQQRLFLGKTTFILASNKSTSSKNKFINSLIDFQSGKKSLSNLKNDLKDISKKTDSTDIQSTILSIINLNNQVLTQFLQKIKFELDEEEILTKCKDAIKADKVPELKIDDTFKKIDSALREDNFITIKKRKKVLITFDSFYNKYRKYYDIARSPSLVIKPFEGVLPDKLEKQIFIKQLIDIGDIESDNFEDIVNFTKFKLQIHNNIEEWHQNGEITIEELTTFKDEAIIQWNNEFRSKYRGDIEEDTINKLALAILDEIRRKNLSISNQLLGTEVSNGYYYKLSDEPIIGWRKDWQKRYKNES